MVTDRKRHNLISKKLKGLIYLPGNLSHHALQLSLKCNNLIPQSVY